MASGAALADAVGEVVVVALPLVAAIVLHEVAHGAVAYLCGDSTAARAGRLTLNPIRHVDPVGTVLVPGIMLLAGQLTGGPPFVFGWAKPVPVDYRQLRRGEIDAILVALAGPGTNLALAAASTALLALVEPTGFLAALLMASLVVNCVIAVFNLLPVPPLDGSRVISALLPRGLAVLFDRIQAVGFIVLILVLMNTNVIGQLTRPVVRFFLGFVTDLP